MSYYGRTNPTGLENIGKAWKKEEIDILLNEIKDKKEYKEIAESHKRTIGGITSRLRSIAANLYVDQDKTVEECIKITGLDKSDIIDAINKREYSDRIKIESKQIKTQVKRHDVSVPTSVPVSELRQEIITIKKDVKEILRLMNLLYEFEASHS